ncbi:hypothetical protein C2G38_2141269 [Gigaspora rosea]|uniref:B30.2/SPRY domain-containing protein n=1 Tax=Gigaspora rosea TaxID=44941 RepID=A0A397VCP1_9GLOM|nr:hypothetical protein C2G38_2141269 [Gigaspora rosea]
MESTSKDLEICGSRVNYIGQGDDSWGYHDDGYFFWPGKFKPYGPSYTTGDTIGCYLNFKEEGGIMFYTKNGVNIGVTCHLPENSENSKKILYPCVGLRSQGGSIEINFGGDRMFKYSDQLLEDYPNDLFALMYRGKSRLIMNMYEEALEDLNKVLESEPKNLLALTYRGKIYFIKEQYEKALETLDKVLHDEPNNALALTFRGKAYFIVGEYEKAFTDLTKALESEPENTIALRYRAETNQMMGRYYESFNDLKELLKVNPDDAWTTESRDFVNKT